jgi:hypothetical protein
MTKMKTDTEVVVANATGLFEVETDQLGSMRADIVTLDDTTYGFSVFGRQGVGGNMEPKKQLLLTFPKRESFLIYDAKDLLDVKYIDYSESHYFEYVVESGSFAVSYTESPRKATGLFSMDMKLKGSPVPPGPERLKVKGFFHLKND